MENTVKHRIGCSGWQYLEWVEKFYPLDLPKSHWFEYYTRYFNTVEINYTFYHFPQAATVKKWEKMAPEYFCFSLKVNRLITHYKKFHETKNLIKEFYILADLLEEKLGCLLFQLPKSITFSKSLLDKIIAQLDLSKRNVIEFRHPSWWCTDAESMLADAGVIFCNVSAPELPCTFTNSKKLYSRLHGEKVWYNGSYSEKTLAEYVEKINNNQYGESWIYFDNTMDVSAPNNALQLLEMLSKNKK